MTISQPYKAWVCIAICSIMLVLTACGSNGGEKGTSGSNPNASGSEKELSGVVKIAVLGFPLDDGINPATGREAKGIKALFEPFLADHPKLSIDYIEVPQDDRKAKWQALLLSNSVDILFLDAAIDFYNQGFLMPLDDYLAKDNWKANFMESLWTDNERLTSGADGKVMGMPSGIATSTVVYDKQIFEDYGVEPLSEKPTADEILEKAKKLTGINPKTGQQTYGMTYNPKGSSHLNLDIFSDGQGVEYGTIDWGNFGNSQLNFNTPAIKKSLQTMIDMDPYLPPGYEIGRGSENWGKESNNVAICLWCNNMDEVLKNNLSDRYVMTKGIRDKNDKTTWGTARVMSMAKDSSNPTASWEVLKYLTGPEGQKFMYDNYKELPSWKNADWVKKEDNPYADQLLAVVQDTKNQLFPPIMFSTIRPWMADIISRAIHGQKYDIDSELAQIQEKVDKWVEEQKAINAQKSGG
ncbi:ABC transporter substrate-binding protein [Paenibacillus mendelii]|uniref:ABC transporter substrate-binding protein n=1 Tax=Paenibacillus mendelii TaxID=206163 RepID=A0ABV6JC74_9BACL|nr:extracellular solute-binding protein [Paenibacillus mendelii]MCQ6561508.1 extracellular solute-binding protein [Paenibacillus mendelii]